MDKYMKTDKYDKKQVTQLLRGDINILYKSISPRIKCRIKPGGSRKACHPEQTSTRGRAYFMQILPKLTNTVCKEWQYCEKIKTTNYEDAVTITCAVADTP